MKPSTEAKYLKQTRSARPEDYQVIDMGDETFGVVVNGVLVEKGISKEDAEKFATISYHSQLVDEIVYRRLNTAARELAFERLRLRAGRDYSEAQMIHAIRISIARWGESELVAVVTRVQNSWTRDREKERLRERLQSGTLSATERRDFQSALDTMEEEEMKVKG